MTVAEIYHVIAAEIAHCTGRFFEAKHCEPLGGGCINEAARLSDGSRSYFVKLNRAELAPLFRAESEGLCALRDTGAIRAPEPICAGVSGEHSWLVLEFIALGPSTPVSERRLGSALADLHRTTASAFGWQRDNAIGSTPQINLQCSDWTEFWARNRLGYQVELAGHNGCPKELVARGEQLIHALPTLLARHRPVPSLVHGDLWAGNAARDDGGAPVIFDPATYHGDRETDLAMTELFGGFGPDFYAAYEEAWPLDSGYPLRRDLYNLYHVLNHLNLFGGSYLAQASRLVERLLGEIY